MLGFVISIRKLIVGLDEETTRPTKINPIIQKYLWSEFHLIKTSLLSLLEERRASTFETSFLSLLEELLEQRRATDQRKRPKEDSGHDEPSIPTSQTAFIAIAFAATLRCKPEDEVTLLPFYVCKINTNKLQVLANQFPHKMKAHRFGSVSCHAWVYTLSATA